jgi:hypothetical protein
MRTRRECISRVWLIWCVQLGFGWCQWDIVKGTLHGVILRTDLRLDPVYWRHKERYAFGVTIGRPLKTDGPEVEH